MTVLRMYQGIIECCARRDPGKLRALADPQAFRLGWAPTVDMLPLEPAIALLRSWCDAFPDFGTRHEQVAVLTRSGLAMVEFQSTFLYAGSSQMPFGFDASAMPAGRNLVIEGVDIIRLNNIGRLVEWKRYYDTGALTEQLLD